MLSTVIVIPVGPVCKLDFVKDTIDSVIHYTHSARMIIIVDDSGTELGERVRDSFPTTKIDLITTPKNYGSHAGLYLSLSLAFLHAINHYDFQVLLRLDTDALIIGEAPDQDAIDYFTQHPNTGILGSYRVDCNGDPRSFAWPRQQLLRETGWPYLLKHPHQLRGVLCLRHLIKTAQSNNYELGEHCMGGSYFLSGVCVRRLAEANLLSRTEIGWSLVHEDQLFGLMIKAIGMRLGDFATGNWPMGLRWRGLPCSPQTLLDRGKKVTHSTRFWQDLEETEIRAFFQEIRCPVD